MNRRFKIILTLFSSLVISIYSLGQTQINNPGFENWDSSPEEPVEWNSFETGDCDLSPGFLCGFAQVQQVESSTDTRPGSTGSFSARIWSRNPIGSVIANGNLTTGIIHLGSSTATDPSNYNYTITSNSDFNEAFTGKPDSIVFWAKFNPVNTTELARMNAVIHDNYDYRDPNTSDPNAPNHIVGKASLNFPFTNGNWQRFSVPFDYASHPATTSAFILITFTTNMNPGGGDENDEVFIDDISFKYVRTEVTPTATQNLIVNQAGSTLTATDYDGTANSREWKYSTTPGGPYVSFGTPETGTTYTPQFATGDVYYVICESDFGGGLVKTSNEVQVNVLENSIAPTATQNIDENVAGNVLTVTETSTASSREWKYTTTSGSGYTSFGTPETGATYTPLFASAGTYYVVCESTNAGGTVTSNEVEIVVSAVATPSVSIAPTAPQTILINENGNTLTANEVNGTATSREWKYTTTSGSGYTSFGTPETGTTYTPNFATAGTYYVICESDFGTIETSNEVEIVVEEPTNSIAPTATQNLNENVAGTQLDVTESHTATSREWMYTTTSGSGYTSFGTPETGTSYTPMFASAGTYYVVCESNFAGGNTIISNEVEIVVTEANSVSIAPTATQNLIENQAGTMLTATESPSAATSREWKFSTTSGSGYASFGTPETGMTYTPQFANAGTYYVVCESDFGGSAVTSNEVEVVVTTSGVGIDKNTSVALKVYSYNNVVVLDASEVSEVDQMNVELVSISGQAISTTSIQAGERVEISNNVATGVYIVNVYNNDIQKQFKLMIK